MNSFILEIKVIRCIDSWLFCLEIRDKTLRQQHPKERLKKRFSLANVQNDLFPLLWFINRNWHGICHLHIELLAQDWQPVTLFMYTIFTIAYLLLFIWVVSDRSLWNNSCLCIWWAWFWHFSCCSINFTTYSETCGKILHFLRFYLSYI